MPTDFGLGLAGIVAVPSCTPAWVALLTSRPRGHSGQGSDRWLEKLNHVLTGTHLDLVPNPSPRSLPHPVRRSPLLLSPCPWADALLPWGAEPRSGHQPSSVTQFPHQVPSYLILRGSQQTSLPLTEFKKVSGHSHEARSPVPGFPLLP